MWGNLTLFVNSATDSTGLVMQLMSEQMPIHAQYAQQKTLTLPWRAGLQNIKYRLTHGF